MSETLQTIKIALKGGKVIEVEAIVFGQHAVHADIDYPGLWMVTHIRTGYGMAAYSVKHVACNFARRLNECYDWDAVSIALENGLAYEDVKPLFDEVVNLSKHETLLNEDTSYERPSFKAVQS